MRERGQPDAAPHHGAGGQRRIREAGSTPRPNGAAGTGGHVHPTTAHPCPKDVSVIICAHSLARRTLLQNAVSSVAKQGPLEVIVVIDHNPALLAWSRANLLTLVVENHRPAGASGARNTGAAIARGTILTFLDDDAVAHEGWLAALTAPFASDGVLGVGGWVEPLWVHRRPDWFPDALLWAIGASYPGQFSTTRAASVQNVWTTNMAIQREVFELAGGFREGFGKLRDVSAPEDTELSQRVAADWPSRRWQLTAEASVSHLVPEDRATAAFLVQRCFSEGLGKAALVGLRGGSAVQTEQRYLTGVIPAAFMDEIRSCARGDVSGLSRAGAIAVGVVATGTGYVYGSFLRRAFRKRDHPGGPTEDASTFAPVHLADVEVTSPIGPLAARGPQYERARVLVRLLGEPVGTVDLGLRDGVLGASELTDGIWEELGTTLNMRLAEGGLAPAARLLPTGLAATSHATRGAPTSPVDLQHFLVDGAPYISVVICTRDGAERLGNMLAAVLDQAYPTFEVIVVDNAPRGPAVRELLETQFVDRPELRYVVEPQPGLSNARNCGLRVARGTHVAYLDDDEVPDRHWLAALAHGFSRTQDVAAVSGTILPSELETRAQVWFEQFGGHSKGRGFEARVFDNASRRSQSPLFPVPPFGAGGNMAFRKDVLQRMGGFDTCLGAGTQVEGAEDTVAFTEVLLRDHAVVYEPGASVRHAHRRDFDQLERQLFGYGAGLGAFYARLVVHHPDQIPNLVRLAPAALRYLFEPDSPRTAKMEADYPRALRLASLRGMAYGPFAYLRSRWLARRGPSCSRLAAAHKITDP